MTCNQPVVVRKHGFFTSLVRGVFGTLIVLIICGTAVGLTAMHLAGNHVGTLLATAAETLPRWREALPPAIVEALDDRRALEYAEQLEIGAEFYPSDTGSAGGRVILTVKNKGDELVSLLGLRVTLADEHDVPRRELGLYAATPFLVDSDWPGPLRAGQTRRLIRMVHQNRSNDLVPTTEVVELRVWREPPVAAAQTLATQAAAAHDYEPARSRR